ncbi:MAG: efflux RND transporter periplasmic adaptor subunit [Flavicella sp.]|nr:efflux RND transporter periplasmic adaptor subunit [Flavicella sp.]
MKKIYLILSCTLLLVSCDSQKEVTVESVIQSGNLENIRLKKKEVEAKQKVFAEKLFALSNAISKLDTVKKLPLVTTQKSEQTIFNHYLELQGAVNTRQNVLLYPEVPGILERVLVKEGNKVKKGQLLAVIKDGGMSQQLQQLESQAALSQTVFERQERLWAQKIGSEIEFLQAKTNYTIQKNAVEQLKNQLEKTNITAPFDGTIDVVYKEEGTVVAPGQGAEVFRILNLDNMYVEAEVPENYVSSITKGKKVQVHFPILGKTITSSVRQVGNFINPNNRSFKVEIDVPNPKKDIKPNLTVQLKINDYQNKNAVLLPQSIISENAQGEQYIYVVVDKQNNGEATAQKVLIETGKTQGDIIEVLAPLSSQVEYIQEGARTVHNGQKVKIVTQ